jgi:tetratricopeptide (TPR) repeat protein
MDRAPTSPCDVTGICPPAHPAQRLMRSGLGAILLSAVIAIQGCARIPAVVVLPSAPPSAQRFDAADRMVRAGCLDCLLDAYREYDELARADTAGERASVAAVRTAALIALRERELGLVDSGYLARARELIAGMPNRPSSLSELIDVADALPFGSPAGRAPALQEQRMLLQVSREWQNSPEPPLGLAAHQELFGYVWLSLACEVGSGRSISPGQALAGIGAMREFPLLIFKYATACDRGNTTELRALLEQEPRFAEINYYLGLAALGGTSGSGLPGRPDLDETDGRFRAAYAWRRNWPALTVMLGNVATTAEDFAGALEFYEQTLALVPDQPDAMLGAMRSLTYLNRHTEAIATADALIAAGRYPGDARYWRALNQVHLSRFEKAWADVELAATLIMNADVPKLAGVIAINRRDFDVARRKLQEASGRRPSDCEVGFYLQTTLSEQRLWSEAASTASQAGTCFDQDQAQLQTEINDLRTSPMAEARRDRLIANRELQISLNARMRAACWFNAAAAHFNSGARDQARLYAEKIVDDDRFGERARDLLSRLSPRP